MVRRKIRSLPLFRGNRVVGILTDTDLLRACFKGIARTKGPDPTIQWRSRPVADFMTREVQTIAPDASVLHAWMLMREHDVSHLAVVGNDSLELVEGIVADDDVYYALRERRDNDGSSNHGTRSPRVLLTEILTRNVISIGKYDKLAKAAETMLSNDISALLVMDSCLEGIITRFDLLRALCLVLYEA
jgi:CBS domain-containing protein